MNLHLDDEAFAELVTAASEGIPGESRKRQLKKAVVDSMNALRFPIVNLEETRSRRSYNCYRVSYPSLYSPVSEIQTELVIETYIALLPFPTVKRMADNYIYRFLKLTGQEKLATEFGLMPFEIITQAIERTLIDKVFAICDYYLSGRVNRHSRHLYDIYKIMKYTIPDASLAVLVQEVRQLREALPICPSAKRGVDINKILTEIIEKEVYKDDYEGSTRKLLFTYIPYDTVIDSLRVIVRQGYFNDLDVANTPSQSV